MRWWCRRRRYTKKKEWVWMSEVLGKSWDLTWASFYSSFICACQYQIWMYGCIQYGWFVVVVFVFLSCLTSNNPDCDFRSQLLHKGQHVGRDFATRNGKRTIHVKEGQDARLFRSSSSRRRRRSHDFVSATVDADDARLSCCCCCCCCCSCCCCCCYCSRRRQESKDSHTKKNAADNNIAMASWCRSSFKLIHEDWPFQQFKPCFPIQNFQTPTYRKIV